MKSYVYLHGFASSSGSSKAQYFKARLAEHGIALAIPELDGGDFEHLTVTGQLGFVERLIGKEECVLLGSSMGGYLAALYAAAHQNVEALVLLAPAFDFRARWLGAMGPAAVEEWRRTGKLSVAHYGRRQRMDLGYELMEDARGYPAYPDFSQRALVMHGRGDDVVPVEYSKRFCAEHANAQFHEFESGHELTNVLPEMWAFTEKFLFA